MKSNILLVSAFLVLVSGVIVHGLKDVSPQIRPANTMMCKDNQCRPPAKDKPVKLINTDVLSCCKDKKCDGKPKPVGCHCGNCR